MHCSADVLTAGLDHVRASPGDGGLVELIVARPDVGERVVLDEATLDPRTGLVGDSWSRRASRHAPDGGPDLDRQLTVMNARSVDLVAGDRSRWPLAGDQLYVDLDISGANLPPGTRLSIGSAGIEVTPAPHTGCAKFRSHFGVDASRVVNSFTGRELNLRGINARVVEGGTIRPGDRVHKVLRGS